MISPSQLFTWERLMKLIVSAILATAALAPLARAATIYQDNFDGAAQADLHGTTPDVGAATWSAHTAFDANGAITPVANGSGAWLPFVPAAGQSYTLSTSFRAIAGNANWFALGFAEAIPANSQLTSNDNRFIGSANVGAAVGKAWMLVRGSNSANPNQTLRGDGVNGTFAAGTLSFVGGPTNGGDVDLRIILDATGGAGTFKATFLAKRPVDASYTDVGGGPLALNAEDIGAVGVVFSNTGVTGSVAGFSLTSVPEPAAMSLASLAVAAAIQARRRRLAAA
jgi:hypothetical protein